MEPQFLGILVVLPVVGAIDSLALEDVADTSQIVVEFQGILPCCLVWKGEQEGGRDVFELGRDKHSQALGWSAAGNAKGEAGSRGFAELALCKLDCLEQGRLELLGHNVC